MSDAVLFETRDHLALITLNRPEARNAIDGAVANGMEAALDRLEDDPDLWLGVLTGAEPVFCAGADLKKVAAGRGDELFTERGGFGGIVRRNRTKPLIAAVEGAALAGGLEVLLACDLVVAGHSTVFGLPEAKRSLVASAGGLVRLPRRIPPAVAAEIAFTATPIDATRAHHLGLVNRLTADGAAIEGALALAAEITANAPIAVRLAKRVLDAAAETSEEEGFEISARAAAEVRTTEDFAEGPRAFIDKRQPRWANR